MVPREDDVSQFPSSEGGDPAAWLEEAIARDPVLRRLLPELRRLAATEAPVLIYGEPGTGAELVARAIHDLSGRGAHPFVMMDCASLSERLLEAEVLGVNGSPSVKPPRKAGIFEQAGPGTVLLTEVDELPPRLQEACLRLLEHREIVRLYSQRPVPAHARCLASTSRDLRARVAAGLFREDLHARLAAERLQLAPLRERPEEIPVLARHFLAQCHGRRCEFAAEVQGLLLRYRWPGNVRELREAIEEAALRAHGGRIGREHLPAHIRREADGGALPSLHDVERPYIERALREAREPAPGVPHPRHQPLGAVAPPAQVRHAAAGRGVTEPPAVALARRVRAPRGRYLLSARERGIPPLRDRQ